MRNNIRRPGSNGRIQKAVEPHFDDESERQFDDRLAVTEELLA